MVTPDELPDFEEPLPAVPPPEEEANLGIPGIPGMEGVEEDLPNLDDDDDEVPEVPDGYLPAADEDLEPASKRQKVAELEPGPGEDVNDLPPFDDDIPEFAGGNAGGEEGADIAEGNACEEGGVYPEGDVYQDTGDDDYEDMGDAGLVGEEEGYQVEPQGGAYAAESAEAYEAVAEDYDEGEGVEGDGGVGGGDEDEEEEDVEDEDEDEDGEEEEDDAAEENEAQEAEGSFQAEAEAEAEAEVQAEAEAEVGTSISTRVRARPRGKGRAGKAAKAAEDGANMTDSELWARVGALEEDDDESFDLEDEEDEEEEEDDEDEDDEDEEEDEEEARQEEARQREEDEEEENPAKSMHASILTRRVDALRDLVAEAPQKLLKEDDLGRNPLHVALLRGEGDLLEVLLTAPEPERLAALKMPFRTVGNGGETKDSIPTLHLALSGGASSTTSPSSVHCLSQLVELQAGVDLNAVDASGRTALHVAARLGAVDCLETLLRARADPNIKDDSGDCPLHAAIESPDTTCLEALIAVSDPTQMVGDHLPFKRCIEQQATKALFKLVARGWPLPDQDLPELERLAARYHFTESWSEARASGLLAREGAATADLPSKEREAWELLEARLPPTEVRMGFVTHQDVCKHGAIPEKGEEFRYRHRLMVETAENPQRWEALCGERGILRSDTFRTVTWHEPRAPAPLTDVLRVHEYYYISRLLDFVSKLNPNREYIKRSFDKGDTQVTPGSVEAAFMAAACVLEAVDLVAGGELNVAFCPVRPPGHHLGPAGATNTTDLDDAEGSSQGFCLLNNVAIGAAYARCVYRHVIKKVAVIDFDVHHGNGTEAIFRNVRKRTHRLVREQDISLRGIISKTKMVMELPPTCKPWLDPQSDLEDLYFASVHGYGGGFYPKSGAPRTSTPRTESAPHIRNVGLHGDANSVEFRTAFRRKVLPELRRFQPDIIFISAGFDGHEDDLVAGRGLVEEDYTWVTQQLKAIANKFSNGRIVSVLEGGYNSRAEGLSPFARSVAAHVKAMLYTSPKRTFVEEDKPGEEERWFHNADLAWRSRRSKGKEQRVAAAEAAAAAAGAEAGPAGGQGATQTEAARTGLAERVIAAVSSMVASAAEEPAAAAAGEEALPDSGELAAAQLTAL